jgi:hypothetical protein
MTAKTMPLPYLTFIPSHLVVTCLGVGGGGFIFGDAVGGINGGVAGAIAGVIVALVTAGLNALVTLRRQNTEGAIAIDKERDAIFQRANEIHAAEKTMLMEHHARENELSSREKAFLQRQVTYHELLEKVTRERLHAMVGEVQRGVTHIRLIEQNLQAEIAALNLPAFKIKNFDEIVAMYPLPNPPVAQSATNPLS